MQEEWKQIEGYEKDYEISSFGQIKSVKNGVDKFMRAVARYRDYPRVSLSKEGKQKGFAVHRLVAIAFIDNPENKPHINHIDGNKKNNHVSNLEWCTHKENMDHYQKMRETDGLLWLERMKRSEAFNK